MTHPHNNLQDAFTIAAISQPYRSAPCCSVIFATCSRRPNIATSVRRALWDLDAGQQAIHDVRDLSRGQLRLAMCALAIPAMYVAVCELDVPILIVPMFPAVPLLPTSMLLLPFVKEYPAPIPNAMLLEPVLFE
jgi:hypothetical protein